MNWLSDILQDFGFAARTFAKRPGFAAVAVFTLALGIAAATTVFSIVEAVLLRPLPYHDPGRLAAIWLTRTREKSLATIFATYADFVEFRRHSRTLENVAGRYLGHSHGPCTDRVRPGSRDFDDSRHH